MEYILNITDWNVNLYWHNVLIIGNWTHSQVCSIMLVKTTQYKLSGISRTNLLRALKIFDLPPTISPELNKCPGSNPVDLGLVISAPKTEYTSVNCNPQPALQVYGDPINHVSDFRYLGSMEASGSSDLKRRKSLAWCAFWKLEQLWKSPHISITTKVKLFNTTCVTILLYGCESWMISQDMENKINTFATSCYRVMLNIKRIDHVLNTTVYSMINTVPLIHLVRHRQLKFLGHILRMSKEEPARRYALYIPTIGKRRPGRPRTSYLNYVQRLLGDNEGAMQEQQIAAFADDRCAWRNLVVACSAADGWWWWVKKQTNKQKQTNKGKKNKENTCKNTHSSLGQTGLDFAFGRNSW